MGELNSSKIATGFKSGRRRKVEQPTLRKKLYTLIALDSLGLWNPSNNDKDKY